ncbi:hypothetical protein SAMN05216327_10253 [Dyadobacter sp. SG02]|uniref:hypothetical protein n=1 Tax=Dyadobacter sp. SG02 TaxID=1855291 RepID=UPI0008D85032|nr:hypothetical protein [Dyadobacter sp. SG02]SEI49955.1 hypothetical protein SAMN05216327_10253 [Dyadobacter sp. SG02]
MSSLEGLKEHLLHLLVVNHGNFRMMEYPHLMAEAKSIGMDTGAMSRLVHELHASINWEPLARIDKQLEQYIYQGIITNEEAESILASVRDVMDRKAAVGYMIAELTRHGFSPREKVTADKDSFRNRWMTDAAWAENRVTVEWLDEMAGSLEKLGEISFRKKELAQYYFRTGQYLSGLVTILTKSASRAHTFERLIEDEKDPELRYLRVIYRLNSALPFRFQGAGYDNAVSLLNAACDRFESFNALRELYRNHHLNVWLEEAHPELSAGLDGEKLNTRFLEFVYSVDPNYPYFLGRHKMADVAALVVAAHDNPAIWELIADDLENGCLHAWLRSTGQGKLVSEFEILDQATRQSGLHEGDESAMASAQTMLLVMDPAMPAPGFRIDPPVIDLTGIESTDVQIVPLRVTMENHGYMKVKLTLDAEEEGVFISKNALILNSFSPSSREVVFELNVDTLRLIKDKMYQLRISASSVYGMVEIPVDVKIVFPTKAYALKLARYAAIFAGFYGGFRYLVGLLLGDFHWLVDSPYLTRQSPFAFFLILVLFISGNFYALKWIRKAEGI